MNTYSKFCPNVFLAKCTEPHEKGDVINVTTKYGQENECIIYNLIFERDGFWYYSVLRADGFNAKERAAQKAEKYSHWANAAKSKSEAAHNRSNEILKYIPPGQPILVGHHSERRHRSDLKKSDSAMRSAIELSEKAQSHEDKAAYWEKKANQINLSMPESLEYYAYKLEEAKEYHAGLKSGKYQKQHSYSLTYAKKNVNDLEKNFKIAKKLWA